MKSRHFFFDHGAYGQGESEIGSPGPRELLVRTTKSLVSVGTEGKCNAGTVPWNKGLHGYSNVGRVIGAGSEVDGFAVGERVFSFRPHVDFYLGNLDNTWFVPYAISEDISDSDATFATLAAVALHAVERARIAVGQTVVVVGQGTVGLLVAQLARIGGAGYVIGVDPDESRHELARSVGVDRVVGLDLDEFAAVCSTGLRNVPAPIFIEACGAASALLWMTQAADIGSRLVLTGLFDRDLLYPVNQIVEKELEIVGAHQPKDVETLHPYYPYSRQFNVTLVLDLIRTGRLKVADLVSDTITPDELIGFYDALREGTSRPRQPLIDWDVTS